MLIFYQLHEIPDIAPAHVFPFATARLEGFNQTIAPEIRSIRSDEYWLDDDLGQGFADGVELYFPHSYVAVDGKTIADAHGGLLSVRILKYTNSSISITAFELASGSARRGLSLVKVGNYHTYGSEKNGFSTILIHGGKFIIMIVGRSDAARDAVARLENMYLK